MAQVKAVAPLTHLPAAPLSASNPTINTPVVANSAARVIPAVTPGLRSLTIGNGTVRIDPTSHTPGNVLDIINGANLAGIRASLDRYGNLLIDGVAAVGGDASLLQQLGLTL